MREIDVKLERKLKGAKRVSGLGDLLVLGVVNKFIKIFSRQAGQWVAVCLFLNSLNLLKADEEINDAQSAYVEQTKESSNKNINPSKEQNTGNKTLSSAQQFLLDSPLATGENDLKKLYNRYRSSIVLIHYQSQNAFHTITGFLVSEEGHILTTAIEGDLKALDGKISYVKVNEQPYSAELLGSDLVTNVALLRLTQVPESLTYISIPNSNEDPMIGDTVLSLSYKLALNVSPQWGYVTGINDHYFNIEWPTKLVRSTLPIDGGDCGGPVFSRSGKLLGMLLHALSETRETYFMPTFALKKIYNDLLHFGFVMYPYVGISVELVLDPQHHQYGLQVMTVQENSPAKKTDLKVGDIIIAFDDIPVNSRETFKDIIFFAQPKQKLCIKVLRGSEEKSFIMQMEEKSSAKPISESKMTTKAEKAQ